MRIIIASLLLLSALALWMPEASEASRVYNKTKTCLVQPGLKIKTKVTYEKPTSNRVRVNRVSGKLIASSYTNREFQYAVALFAGEKPKWYTTKTRRLGTRSWTSLGSPNTYMANKRNSYVQTTVVGGCQATVRFG